MPALTWLNQHKFFVLGAGVVVLIVAVAVGFWFFILRDTATPVNLRQALRLYRQDQHAGKATNASELPPPGVYRYRTTGDEQLSFGGIKRLFPSATNMIVTENGCATEKWEPFEQHMEGIVECPLQSGAYGITTTLSYEQIAGTQTTDVIRCPPDTYLVPPDAHAGERWHAVCHSTGLNVDWSGVVVGNASVNVGGHAVPAIHTRLTLTFSGAESGTNPNDYWVSAKDGLILSQRETVDVSQQAGPLGSVRYSEQMAIRIASPTPVR
ncbi:MAG: hypothetical protein ABSC41_05925 [Acidimicrobiales bacterium]|jgi:hypothetical protein